MRCIGCWILGATLVACGGGDDGGRMPLGPGGGQDGGADDGGDGDDDGSGDDGTGDGGGDDGTDDGDAGDDVKFDLPTEDAPGGDDDDECEVVSKEAENKLVPADIIFAVDNSGSMALENLWVSQRMNGFSQQIFLANIEAQVTLIASYPSNDGLCIGIPLGSGGCPLSDTNLPSFLHIDDKVGSNDAFAKILSQHPQWQSMMRTDSVKHIVVVTDDDSDMSASAFDAAFKALDPNYADYVFHAIAVTDGPLMNPTCWALPPIAAAKGDEYIALATATGGVLGNMCDQDFQPVFDAISEKVVTDAPLACEWDIPAPPPGETFDPMKVNVEFETGGAPTEIGFVEDPADCAGVADGWYYDDNAMPTKILFCPQTCTKVQAASDAKVTIQFGCATKPAG